MSTQLKFTPITESIKDTITGDEIPNGHKLYIPFELFQKYNFKAKIKLYCPTVNFLETQFMMHAWSMTSFTGQMVKKETHLNSMEWANVMNFKQPSAMYWPEIQQCDIEEFSYCILMIVQLIVDSDIHEFVLEIEEGN